MEALAKQLQSLGAGPRLLALPPPVEEINEDDICFLGPNGENDLDKVIFCRQLPAAMRSTVGSWYLTAERQITENVLFTIISLLIIYYVRIESGTGKINGNTNIAPSRRMRSMIFIVFTLVLLYKVFGFNGKLFQMLLPCNILWMLALFLSLSPTFNFSASETIIQLFMCYVTLPILALLTPDLSDCDMFLEIPFFFLHHICLLIIPVYYITTRRVSVLGGCDISSLVRNLKYWVLSCAYFALFYFPFVSTLSVWSGINLNYMLSPPPTPGQVLGGINFRLVGAGFGSIFLAIGRILMGILEFVVCFSRTQHAGGSKINSLNEITRKKS